MYAHAAHGLISIGLRLNEEVKQSTATDEYYKSIIMSKWLFQELF